MRVLKDAIMACFMAGMLLDAGHGETLVVTDSVIISAQNADFSPDSVNGFYITEVYISDDAIYATCDQGIIARYRGEEHWRLVAGREEYLATLGDKVSAAQKASANFCPSQIWKLPWGELGLYDIWTCRFYSLDPGAPQSKRLRLLKDFDEKLVISDFNVEKDILLCGLYSIQNNRMVGLLNPDLSKCRRIFDIPAKLRHDLDSMGADYYPLPALNPNDSAIWVSFRHYNRVYIINPQGEVMDSVPITHPDFVLPQPPASRIKSRAVFDDWYSKCASVYSLQFVPPGYFLLQFSSPGKRTADDRPLHLLFWNADAQPVDLAVNPKWRIKQVQSDGCLPFVAYERDGGVVKRAVIYLTRIMP